jgi:hypothetical protein
VIGDDLHVTHSDAEGQPARGVLPWPGEGAVAIEALVRLLGLRRSGRPQAGQRLEAEVVEDLDLAAQLDENQQSMVGVRAWLLRR